MTFKAEFADGTFKLREWPDGSPYIGTLENGPKTNSILNETTSFLMTLQEGTTMDEAGRLVDHLNQLVKQISIQQH
jgi:hypothetical protein